MTSFAFTFESRSGETGRLTGTARLEEQGVRIEWMKETQFFPRQTQIKEIKLGFGDIESVNLETGWFRNSVVLMVRSMDLIKEASGVHPSGGLRLHIEKSQRGDARKFISILELKISEDRLKRSGDPLES